MAIMDFYSRHVLSWMELPRFRGQVDRSDAMNPVTFREGVTSRLPLRRRQLMVALGTVLVPLVVC